MEFRQNRKSKIVKPSEITNFDVSTLENWRVPNNSDSSLLENLKTCLAKSGGVQSDYHKLMLSLRQSYTSRSGLKFDREEKKFDRKPSATSNASTVSVGSGDKATNSGIQKSRYVSKLA